MTLIKSISGIRGTIGGQTDENLTPIDIVKFSAAFGQWAMEHSDSKTIVIGRDARPSGAMVSQLVSATLQGMGMDVVDLGMATTPTVEIAVPLEKAAGGIILTASHNPKQWNALKLLNNKGEFISGENGQDVLEIAEGGNSIFAEVDQLGSYSKNDSYLDKHIEMILDLPDVDAGVIKEQNFSVAVDAVNSIGGEAVPALLKALGVQNITEINCKPDGEFAHNPEPLPENITQICSAIKSQPHTMGIVVDPDVDRLALVDEKGDPFGEEYTLVLIADYLLRHNKGNTVSNLSSSRALRDITQQLGGQYEAAAVGEVNVVKKMKATKAIFGGEGNGGVIFPELHYGRDALVGIALILTHLAKSQKSLSALKAGYPAYHISKNKITLTPEIHVENILKAMQEKYAAYPVNTIDGVKIDFENEWVHLRKSNTEPIIRIYTEAANEEKAEELADTIKKEIKRLTSALV